MSFGKKTAAIFPTSICKLILHKSAIHYWAIYLFSKFRCHSWRWYALEVFSYYWSFMRGFHWLPLCSPHRRPKVQSWCFLCGETIIWTNSWALVIWYDRNPRWCHCKTSKCGRDFLARSIHVLLKTRRRLAGIGIAVVVVYTRHNKCILLSVYSKS